MGIGFGESGGLQSSSNPFGELSPLSAESQNKATNRAIQALQDCGLASDATEAKRWMSSDPFYQKAANVLSYLDNTVEYNMDVNVTYQSFGLANSNAIRWRTAVAEHSTYKGDYAFLRK